jgi:hypothetical protein
MLRRRIVVGFVVFVVIAIVGLLIVAIVGQRAKQDRVYSLNNMRELGQFAILAGRPDQLELFGPGKEAELARLKALPAPTAIPAGTLPNATLKPDERLSWIPLALPYMNQRRQDTSELLTGLNRDVTWNAPVNVPFARTAIRGLIPTAINQLPDADEPAPTYYVGMAGIGPDAATLPIKNARAGCFRYDTATPFADIDDGLRQSILFTETANGIGPWLQGGPSTVRGVDEKAPLFGPSGQFGGVHPGFFVVGYADGSASVVTDQMNRTVFLALCTINGGKTETIPGE